MMAQSFPGRIEVTESGAVMLLGSKGSGIFWLKE